MAGLIPGIFAGVSRASEGGTAGESFREAAFAGLPGFSETALTSAQFNKLQEESRTIRGERERSNRIVTIDSITQGLGVTAKRKMVDTLRREGVLTEDGTGVRAGDLQSRTDKFLDEPEEIIEFATDNITDIDNDLKRANVIRDDAIVKEAKRLVGSQVKLGNIPKGSEEIAEQAAVKELQNDPAFNQEINRLNDRRQQFMEQIELQKDIVRRFKEEKAQGITVPAKTVDQLKAREAQRIAIETGREPIDVLQEIERSLEPGLVEQTATDFNIDLRTASDEEWEVIAAAIAKNNLFLSGILTGEFLKAQYEKDVGAIAPETDPLGIR